MKKFVILSLILSMTACTNIDQNGIKPNGERKAGELQQLLGQDNQKTSRRIQAMPIEVLDKVMAKNEIEKFVSEKIIPRYGGKNARIVGSKQAKLRELKAENSDLAKWMLVYPDEYNVTVVNFEGDFEIAKGPDGNKPRNYKYLTVISRSSDGLPVSVSAHN